MGVLTLLKEIRLILELLDVLQKAFMCDSFNINDLVIDTFSITNLGSRLADPKGANLSISLKNFSFTALEANTLSM